MIKVFVVKFNEKSKTKNVKIKNNLMKYKISSQGVVDLHL